MDVTKVLAQDAEEGMVYLTKGGRKVKVLKVRKSEDGEVTVRVIARLGEEDEARGELPGTFPLFKSVNGGKSTKNAVEEDQADEAEEESNMDDEQVPAQAAETEGEAEGKKGRRKGGRKGGKGKKGNGGASEARKARLRKWAKLSTSEVSEKLKKAKEKGKLSRRWFVIEALMRKSYTPKALAEAVASAYKIKDRKASRVVRSTLRREASRLTVTGEGKERTFRYKG